MHLELNQSFLESYLDNRQQLTFPQLVPFDVIAKQPHYKLVIQFPYPKQSSSHVDW